LNSSFRIPIATSNGKSKEYSKKAPCVHLSGTHFILPLLPFLNALLSRPRMKFNFTADSKQDSHLCLTFLLTHTVHIFPPCSSKFSTKSNPIDQVYLTPHNKLPFHQSVASKHNSTPSPHVRIIHPFPISPHLQLSDIHPPPLPYLNLPNLTAK
jgi:hypothetical protein